MSDATRVCRTCSKCLPLSAFSVRKDTGKPQTECKQCKVERTRQWKQANPDRYNATQRAVRQRLRADPARWRHTLDRDNARRRKGPTRYEVVCFRCERPFEYVRTTQKRTVCPPCREVDWAWTQYGLSSVTLAAFYEAAGNRCEICGGTESPTQWGNRFHIDHDHVTGELRGLLCTSCNAGLGQFADDPDRLRRAAEYLETHRRPNDQPQLIT